MYPTSIFKNRYRLWLQQTTLMCTLCFPVFDTFYLCRHSIDLTTIDKKTKIKSHSSSICVEDCLAALISS